MGIKLIAFISVILIIIALIVIIYSPYGYSDFTKWAVFIGVSLGITATSLYCINRKKKNVEGGFVKEKELYDYSMDDIKNEIALLENECLEASYIFKQYDYTGLEGKNLENMSLDEVEAIMYDLVNVYGKNFIPLNYKIHLLNVVNSVLSNNTNIQTAISKKTALGDIFNNDFKDEDRIGSAQAKSKPMATATGAKKTTATAQSKQNASGVKKPVAVSQAKPTTAESKSSPVIISEEKTQSKSESKEEEILEPAYENANFILPTKALIKPGKKLINVKYILKPEISDSVIRDNGIYALDKYTNIVDKQVFRCLQTWLSLLNYVQKTYNVEVKGRELIYTEIPQIASCSDDVVNKLMEESSTQMFNQIKETLLDCDQQIYDYLTDTETEIRGFAHYCTIPSKDDNDRQKSKQYNSKMRERFGTGNSSLLTTKYKTDDVLRYEKLGMGRDKLLNLYTNVNKCLLKLVVHYYTNRLRLEELKKVDQKCMEVVKVATDKINEMRGVYQQNMDMKAQLDYMPELIKQRDEAIEKIQKLDREIADIDEGGVVKKLATAERKIDELSNEIKEKTEIMEKLRESEQTARASSLDTITKLANADAEIISLKTQLSNLKAEKRDLIEEQNLLNKQILKLKSELVDAKKDLKFYYNESDRITDILKGLSAPISGMYPIKNKIENSKYDIQVFTEKFKKLSVDLKGLLFRKDNNHKIAINEIQTEVENKMKEIEKLKEQLQLSRQQVAEHDKENGKLKETHAKEIYFLEAKLQDMENYLKPYMMANGTNFQGMYAEMETLIDEKESLLDALNSLSFDTTDKDTANENIVEKNLYVSKTKKIRFDDIVQRINLLKRLQTVENKIIQNIEKISKWNGATGTTIRMFENDYKKEIERIKQEHEGKSQEDINSYIDVAKQLFEKRVKGLENVQISKKWLESAQPTNMIYDEYAKIHEEYNRMYAKYDRNDELLNTLRSSNKVLRKEINEKNEQIKGITIDPKLNNAQIYADELNRLRKLVDEQTENSRPLFIKIEELNNKVESLTKENESILDNYIKKYDALMDSYRILELENKKLMETAVDANMELTTKALDDILVSLDISKESVSEEALRYMNSDDSDFVKIKKIIISNIIELKGKFLGDHREAIERLKKEIREKDAERIEQKRKITQLELIIGIHGIDVNDVYKNGDLRDINNLAEHMQTQGLELNKLTNIMEKSNKTITCKIEEVVREMDKNSNIVILKQLMRKINNNSFQESDNKSITEVIMMVGNSYLEDYVILKTIIDNFTLNGIEQFKNINKESNKHEFILKNYNSMFTPSGQNKYREIFNIVGSLDEDDDVVRDVYTEDDFNLLYESYIGKIDKLYRNLRNEKEQLEDYETFDGKLPTFTIDNLKDKIKMLERVKNKIEMEYKDIVEDFDKDDIPGIEQKIKDIEYSITEADEDTFNDNDDKIKKYKIYLDAFEHYYENNINRIKENKDKEVVVKKENKLKATNFYKIQTEIFKELLDIESNYKFNQTRIERLMKIAIEYVLVGNKPIIEDNKQIVNGNHGKLIKETIRQEEEFKTNYELGKWDGEDDIISPKGLILNRLYEIIQYIINNTTVEESDSFLSSLYDKIIQNTSEENDYLKEEIASAIIEIATGLVKRNSIASSYDKSYKSIMRIHMDIKDSINGVKEGIKKMSIFEESHNQTFNVFKTFFGLINADDVKVDSGLWDIKYEKFIREKYQSGKDANAKLSTFKSDVDSYKSFKRRILKLIDNPKFQIENDDLLINQSYYKIFIETYKDFIFLHIKMKKYYSDYLEFSLESLKGTPQEIEILKEKNKEIIDKLKTTADELVSSKKRIEELENEVNYSAGKITDLETSINRLNVENKEYKETIEKLREELSKKENIMGDTNQEYKELLIRKRELENQLNIIKTEMRGTITISLDNLKKDMRATDNQLKTLTNDVKRLSLIEFQRNKLDDNAVRKLKELGVEVRNNKTTSFIVMSLLQRMGNTKSENEKELLEKALDDIEKVKSENMSISESMKKAEDALLVANKQIEILQQNKENEDSEIIKELNKNVKQIEKIENELAEKNEEINELRFQLEEMKSGDTATQSNNDDEIRMQSTIDKLNEELSSLRMECDDRINKIKETHSLTVEELENSISSLKTKSNSIYRGSDCSEQIEQLENEYRKYKELYDGLDNKNVSFINNAINEYMNKKSMTTHVVKDNVNASEYVNQTEELINLQKGVETIQLELVKNKNNSELLAKLAELEMKLKEIMNNRDDNSEVTTEDFESKRAILQKELEEVREKSADISEKIDNSLGSIEEKEHLENEMDKFTVRENSLIKQLQTLPPPTAPFANGKSIAINKEANDAFNEWKEAISGNSIFGFKNDRAEIAYKKWRDAVERNNNREDMYENWKQAISMNDVNKNIVDDVYENWKQAISMNDVNNKVINEQRDRAINSLDMYKKLNSKSLSYIIKIIEDVKNMDSIIGEMAKYTRRPEEKLVSYDSELQEKKKELETCSNKIQSLTTQIQMFEAKNYQAEKLNALLREKAEHTTKMYNELMDEINKLDEENDAFVKENSALKSNIASLLEKIEILNQKMEEQTESATIERNNVEKSIEELNLIRLTSKYESDRKKCSSIIMNSITPIINSLDLKRESMDSKVETLKKSFNNLNDLLEMKDIQLKDFVQKNKELENKVLQLSNVESNNNTVNREYKEKIDKLGEELAKCKELNNIISEDKYLEEKHEETIQSLRKIIKEDKIDKNSVIQFLDNRLRDGQRMLDLVDKSILDIKSYDSRHKEVITLLKEKLNKSIEELNGLKAGIKSEWGELSDKIDEIISLNAGSQKYYDKLNNQINSLKNDFNSKVSQLEEEKANAILNLEKKYEEKEKENEESKIDMKNKIIEEFVQSNKDILFKEQLEKIVDYVNSRLAPVILNLNAGRDNINKISETVPNLIKQAVRLSSPSSEVKTVANDIANSFEEAVLKINDEYKRLSNSSLDQNRINMTITSNLKELINSTTNKLNEFIDIMKEKINIMANEAVEQNSRIMSLNRELENNKLSHSKELQSLENLYKERANKFYRITNSQISNIKTNMESIKNNMISKEYIDNSIANVKEGMDDIKYFFQTRESSLRQEIDNLKFSLKEKNKTHIDESNALKKLLSSDFNLSIDTINKLRNNIQSHNIIVVETLTITGDIIKKTQALKEKNKALVEKVLQCNGYEDEINNLRNQLADNSNEIMLLKQSLKIIETNSELKDEEIATLKVSKADLSSQLDTLNVLLKEKGDDAGVDADDVKNTIANSISNMNELYKANLNLRLCKESRLALEERIKNINQSVVDILSNSSLGSIKSSLLNSISEISGIKSIVESIRKKVLLGNSVVVRCNDYSQVIYDEVYVPSGEVKIVIDMNNNDGKKNKPTQDEFSKYINKLSKRTI